MQIEAPQRLSTAIIQLPTGDSVVEAMVDLQVEPPAVISWDQVHVHAVLDTSHIAAFLPQRTKSLALLLHHAAQHAKHQLRTSALHTLLNRSLQIPTP